jgi:hypothetical protein
VQIGHRPLLHPIAYWLSKVEWHFDSFLAEWYYILLPTRFHYLPRNLRCLLFSSEHTHCAPSSAHGIIPRQIGRFSGFVSKLSWRTTTSSSSGLRWIGLSFGRLVLVGMENVWLSLLRRTLASVAKSGLQYENEEVRGLSL